MGNGHPHPFSEATGQYSYLFVAVDYITKWFEAAAVASITTAELRKFIWRNIITHFDIPRAIIFDNNRQFDTSKLTDYLSNLGCQARFTTVAHPRTNGQAEVANKSILHGLQKKLDNTNSKWVDELHGVHGYFLLGHPGVTRSQDLTMSWTRESLAVGPVLMKLAEGCAVSGEGPPVV